MSAIMSVLLCGSWIGCQSQREYSTSCGCFKLLVHKMFVGHAPGYIASVLTPASDISSQSSLRSSSNCDLVVPGTSRKIGDRAFSVAAPRAWNRLPTDLKLLRLTASFKSKLKSFLFDACLHREHCELRNAPYWPDCMGHCCYCYCCCFKFLTDSSSF